MATPEHVGRDAAARAVRNIVHRIGRPASLSAMIVASASKRDFAAQVAAALREDGISAYPLELAGEQDPAKWEPLRRLMLKALTDMPGGNQLQMEVTAPAGTRVTLVPRRWNDSGGEVFTAPVEGMASGVIVVDGCAYSGPPKEPFALKLKGGQVTNLDELEKTDDQQRMVFDDLTRDQNARVFAEFGIGVNPEADPDSDLMEAEQARGTCHFGFGHNVEYGGANVSSYHFDVVVRRPTIKLGDRVIIREGVLAIT